ncbi:hypothetical protein CCB80_04410 [Armatimonadetes bacterium Uphvl-Ar1]|nr:hypothetical protein CCB80_04410 [Armatimonadetes bacterium Uphvl-Ar1]
MIIAALAGILLAQTPTITRDSYGVPMIKAQTQAEAFRLMGQAIAEDRLWQLEMARRSSLGQMSEVFGPSTVAADTATLQKQYTPEEYADMIDQLPANVKVAWSAYVQGINDTITNRVATNTLPEGYTTNRFVPRPWTLTDSAAIAVNLSRQFGQGGAGELRNYALVQYLRTRPTVRDNILDVLDDLAWQNEPLAPTTVEKRDDVTLRAPEIFNFNRPESEAHLKALPNTNLLELAGAVRLASMEDAKLVAESNSVVHKMGSYAIVVSPRRSITNHPILLTAPQMGHNTPSVVHEAAIETPDLKVAGMNVPGIPGIVIGYTPHAAWGFTSGVADLEDIFVSPLKDSQTYTSADIDYKLDEIPFTLKVNGEPDRTVTQLRTIHGPVLLKSNSSKAVYSLRSPFWKREIASTAALFDLYAAKQPSDFSIFAAKIPVSFNLFFATKQGDIGYRFCGFMPIRARGVDPRLPTLDTKDNQWRGFVSSVDMPRADNPTSGLLTNWNNKPIAWWPNGDTPVWGRYFRSKNIPFYLQSPKLSPELVERAAFTIAREDHDTFQAFQPQFIQSLAPHRASSLLRDYNGKNLIGTPEPLVFNETITQLRRELFLNQLGNFTADNLFVQVLQPDVIINALNGTTKFNYLGTRSKSEVITAAQTKAIESLEKTQSTDYKSWKFTPGQIRYTNQDPIPYNARGTYIQITEFGQFWPSARSVAGPGVSESGPNATTQIPLIRDWKYKVMWGWE